MLYRAVVLYILMVIPVYSYTMTEKYFKAYVSNYARVYNGSKKIKEYQDTLWNIWSTRYTNVNPLIVLNLGWAESEYTESPVSCVEAVGPWQVRPANWMHLLYYVDYGRLQKEWNLDLMSPREKFRFFHEIRYSFEMCCLIIRAKAHEYGSEELAVLAYRYGDAPGNVVFSWRRSNMYYWRNETYYLKVFRIALKDTSINMNYNLYFPESIN